MIAIHQMTRFLAGLGEIVNILTAPIVAALAYLAAMERFMGERYMGRHMDDQMMNDQMMAQYANHQDMAIFTSIIIAVVAVGFINGGFAVLFSMRQLLAEAQSQASIKTTSMKPTAKDAAKSETAKGAAQDMPQNTVKPAPKIKAKAKVKAKKARKKSA